MGKIPKIIMLFIAFMLVSTNLWAVNTLQTIPYEGMVYDAAGTPLSGLQNFTFSLIQSPSSNTDLWSENFINQPVDNGKFSVLLGSNTAIPPELILYSSLYLVMTVNGDRSSTPLPITGYMYSLFANYAQTANAVLYVDGKVIKAESVNNEKIITLDAAKIVGVLNNVASTANVAITALTANVALYLDGSNIKDASILDGKIITLDATKVVGVLNNVASTANVALIALTADVAISALTANVALYLNGLNIKDASISDGKIITLDATKVVGVLNNVASTANVALIALTADVAITALTANNLIGTINLSQVLGLLPSINAALVASLNLSDLKNSANARINLGLGTLATLNFISNTEITDNAAISGNKLADNSIPDAKIISISVLKIVGVPATANFALTADIALTANVAITANNLSGTINLSQVLGLLPSINAALVASLNLSDLNNTANARINLGLGTLATLNFISNTEISDNAAISGYKLADNSIPDAKIISISVLKIVGVPATANLALTADIAITANFANNVPSYFVTSNYGYNVSVNGVISANSFIGNDLYINKATIRGSITHLTYTLSIAGGGDYNLNSHGESVIFLTASKNIMLPTATDSTIGNVYKIYYTNAVTADINAQSGQTVNNNGYYSLPKTTSTAEWAYVEVIGFTNTSWIAISGGPYAP